MEAMLIKMSSHEPISGMYWALRAAFRRHAHHVHMGRAQHASAAGYTELKILFDNPWLVAVTRWRLAGEAPHPRSGNTLCCFGEHLDASCVVLSVPVDAAP